MGNKQLFQVFLFRGNFIFCHFFPLFQPVTMGIRSEGISFTFVVYVTAFFVKTIDFTASVSKTIVHVSGVFRDPKVFFLFNHYLSKILWKLDMQELVSFLFYCFRFFPLL